MKDLTSNKTKKGTNLGAPDDLSTGAAKISNAQTPGVGVRVQKFMRVYMARVWIFVCDILALHLVQVVLSPQSPLETPEGRENSFNVPLRSDDKCTHPGNLKHLRVVNL